ncbi:hypothetical protein TA3x_004640 [Tundrisphaera sp. TA3]|uniref:hypothetical protein n=1 Tax=Tundrisphaera sp. TA3 TaxID=3435775 RepID=UPI003EBE425A
MFRITRSLAPLSLFFALGAAGCGGEKMNETETRGGTRVDNVAPVTNQGDIGAADDVNKLKKENAHDGSATADASTPYGGGGAGAAPPVSPAPGAPPSGDTNSGQTSGSKSGAGSDATTEGAKPTPGAAGPGTNQQP